MTRRMVFDVESVGLHGEGWAVGYMVLIDEKTVDESWAYCNPGQASGAQAGRDWVAEHCPWGAVGMHPAVRSEHGLPAGRRFLNPVEVRRWFWERWLEQRAAGAELWADVPWPVEARFLAACVEDGLDWSAHGPSALVAAEGGDVNLPAVTREAEAPYPLLDVRSLVEAVAIMDRGRPVQLEDEPTEDDAPTLVHHPLSDARQSAKKLLQVERLLKWLRQA